MNNEMISVGSCPQCGGPAQFVDSQDGLAVRHLDLTEAHWRNRSVLMNEELRLLRRLAATASDLRLVRVNSKFASLNGCSENLIRQNHFEALDNYEIWIEEQET